MNMEEGKIASDRQLFSELFENPIHPLFIHMVPPFVDENQWMFHLQLSGEALWKWRDVCAPGTLFELLQASILPLSYQLHDSALLSVKAFLKTWLRLNLYHLSEELKAKST